MKALCPSLTSLAVAVSWSGTCFAHEPAASVADDAASSGQHQEGQRRGAGFEASVGGQITRGLGMVCRPEGTDLVSCAPDSPAALGVAFSPRWRLNDEWSVGALGHLGWGGGTTLARMGGEGRWRPWGLATWAPWIGIDAGAVLAVDTPRDPGAPDEGTHTWAPAFGAGLGIDWAFHPALALGLELRGAMLAFGSRDPMSQPTLLQRYEDTFAATLAIVGTFVGG